METYPIRELLADDEPGQSEFQLDHFVVARNGCTLYGRYKQTLRELAGRVEAVRSVALERRRVALEIERLVSQRCFRRTTRQLRELELVQKRTEWHALCKQFATARRELKHFYRLACRLKSQLGPLDAGARRVLDAHMWQTKIKAMAAMDFFCCGRLRERTVELLLSLPLPIRRQLIERIKDPKSLMAWFESYEPHYLEASPVSVNRNGSNGSSGEPRLSQTG